MIVAAFVLLAPTWGVGSILLAKAALREIDRYGRRGKGAATTALVLGWAVLVPLVIIAVASFIGLAISGEDITLGPAL